MSTIEEGELKQRKQNAHNAISVDKDTYVAPVGRTRDQTFKVPYTTDMVTSIFNPLERKSRWDWVILATIALHLGIFFVLRGSFRIAVFVILFAFWRSSYDAGIGFLLHKQSNGGWMVSQAKKTGVFTDKNRFYRYVRRELEQKMGSDYDFDKMPIEYNTWLLFRRLVDMILMLDFFSYIILACSCINFPAGQNVVFHSLRWITGSVLIWFNVWVKRDAHRVVKDFAWYADLTFDGVFEMAPHPMYSVGYAGYYGISLMACSYTVLFASLAGHAAQFVFLTWVENPHIEKTYGGGPTSQRKIDDVLTDDEGSVTLNGDDEVGRDTVVFKSFDPLRATDLALVALIGYALSVAVVSAYFKYGYLILLAQALLWRGLHSVGHGAVLISQSHWKAWTGHFLKYGNSPREAWRQWKSLYNITLCMTYTTFLLFSWSCYSLPSTWRSGTVLLRHVLGVIAIGLHIWTSLSIYEALGDFGWFFGDFFVDDQLNELSYTGIYRYLNNPERLMGTLAFWGVAVITNSVGVFLLAIIAQISNLCLIGFVEAPHMRKLYGDSLRKEAGLTKSIKRAARIPPPMHKTVVDVKTNVDKVLSEMSDNVEGFLGTVEPRFRNGFRDVLQDTSILLDRYQSLTRLATHIKVHPSQFTLSILHESKSEDGFLRLELGSAIHASWSAPKEHSNKDWIGIYPVIVNESKEKTSVASKGRWTWVNRDPYDNSNCESISKEADDGQSGEITFSGPRLPWKVGTYELRLHHDKKHNVMAISQPFEICISRSEANDIEGIDRDLKPYIQNVVESNTEQGLDEKSAKIVSYVIRMMFGIDLSSEVILADATSRRIARRICNAKKVLKPFASNPSANRLSMASSTGGSIS